MVPEQIISKTIGVLLFWAFLLPLSADGKSAHLEFSFKQNECFVNIPGLDQSFLLLNSEEDLLRSEHETQPRILLLNFLTKRKAKNKKLIAALLAFPFPFGIVGLHRIYLGTAPHVPIVYIATVGGGFGILPLIDFFVILSSPDIESYFNNQQVFMWKP